MAGSGLAIGWAVWPRATRLNWAAAPGESLINAYLKIGPDGRITVAVAQAEMGQGIWSALAQIIADELGADWQTVGVEPAPLGPDYANPGLTAASAARQSEPLRSLILGAGRRVARFLDFQITGGSNSVRAWEMPLRAAGAAAREMLVKAAARRWQVEWTEVDTAGGFVIYKANRLAFHELMADIDPNDAPVEPTLRSERRLAGQPVLRLDIPAKVDGSARFGIDVRLPNMGFAAIAQGPLGSRPAPLGKVVLPPGVRLVEEESFVACVADNWFAAHKAVTALPIKWQQGKDEAPGPWQIAAVRGALAADGKPFGPTGRVGEVVRDEGDVGAVLKSGVLTVEYSLPFLAHACLEPMTATARVVDDRAEIWAPTQSASLAARAVARALGSDDVIIHPTLIGGGFGRKVEGDACAQAALIARAVGRPVQLIWSREEDFGHDMYRPAAAARLHGKATPAGIQGWNTAIAVPDVGAAFAGRNIGRIAGGPSAGAGAIEGAVELPYAIPNMRVQHCLADCTAPLGFWRSVGHSFTGFIVESFVDELAIAAAVDPASFRLTMLKDKPRHAAVLQAVMEMGGPLGRDDGGSDSPTDPVVGRGLALVESFGSIVAQIAEVEAVPGQRPRVTRVWAAVDCGRVINPDTVVAQIEGGIIYGLSAALFGRIDFAQGAVAQSNFHAYPLVTMADCPEIETRIIASDADPGGIGEPGTPPIAPAVANALFAATGKRWRNLPFFSA
ncbi:molybdopterin cofactor-binding domain-containing protein [Sandarakinorhabdus sp. AAP62]|uniref:xanthine dehydrogenase family protein molybdopterin-binding subunit n=1 Tax=Sandarakinorhabdus sp. AAP62 TaxID=1248916 RepID=UPI0002F3DA2F|nr:molybdopterin cofactor-binding domain-containing protein [Sandarakinorhabdus sp. AAP62]